MIKLKSILLLIFFVTLGKKTLAQIGQEDLKKYSYHVVGFRIIENKHEFEDSGTGFFLKKGDKYYFVAAWHCFSFKNHITQNYSNPNSQFINDIVIYRNLSDISKDNYLKIKLSDLSTAKPNYLSIFQDERLLDISAIEIKWLSAYNFDYYEFEDDNNLVPATLEDKVFYYGFPIIDGKQRDISEYYEGTVVEINDELGEYTMKITGYEGCSGAPLYILKDNKAILKGVLFYGLKDNTGKANYLKAIDIKHLINYLK